MRSQTEFVSEEKNGAHFLFVMHIRGVVFFPGEGGPAFFLDLEEEAFREVEAGVGIGAVAGA